MVKVMIAGKFDPLHDGHLDHIIKASALGDQLIVVTHTDEVINKLRPCQVPLWARMFTLKAVLNYIGIEYEVILALDSDGTVAKTLHKVRPDIFAKGGDRTESNMPQDELDVCAEIGCRIIYGVGDLLNASSKLQLC